MSPEVTSLELCKRLSVLLPDAKTEFVFCDYLEFPGEVYVKERVWAIEHQLNIICPAWQIHELLEKLPYFIAYNSCFYYLTIYKWEDGYDVVYQHKDNGELESEHKVRLVDALTKLLIWKEGGGVKQ